MSMRTVLYDVNQLPSFSPTQELVIDVETTSFADATSGLYPFSGHRIAGVAITTYPYTGQSWYLPLRHRGLGNNFNLENGRKWLKDVAENAPSITNHNIKFDAKFWWVDGIWAKGKLIDTLVQTRIVYNPLPDGTKDYSLSHLAKVLLNDSKKEDKIKSFLKDVRSKDYGVLPVELCGDYAMGDVELTAKLREHNTERFPEVSSDLWEKEIELTKHLLRGEIKGLRADVPRIKSTLLQCLKEKLPIHHEFADKYSHLMPNGEEFDPTNRYHVAKLMAFLGYAPSAFTPKGQPQWNNAVLNSIGNELTTKLVRVNHLGHFIGTYCEGWLERVGLDGRLHPQFKQAGTRTGRMSCSDPNMQNIPEEADSFIICDEGQSVIAWDYSQIEYRIFGHYTQDPVIVEAYRLNPRADFHQLFADILGVDRQFAKSLNFSFLFGMGKKKLLKIISVIAKAKQLEGDENFKAKLRTFVHQASSALSISDTFGTKEFEAIAQSIYNDYHKRVPSIKRFNREVIAKARSRGWTRNFCGRICTFGPDTAHKSMNTVIQGSAGDIVKQRITALMNELGTDRPDQDGVHLMTTVHDSVFLSVPRDRTQEVLDIGTKILEDVKGVRIPIIVEAKVTTGSLGSLMKVETDLEKLLRETVEETEVESSASAKPKPRTKGRLIV